MIIPQMRGMGVLTTLIRMEEIAPRRLSVTKSPRHDAIGGAILSKRKLDASRTKPRSLAWVASKPSADNNQETHEGTESNARQACGHHS